METWDTRSKGSVLTGLGSRHQCSRVDVLETSQESQRDVAQLSWQCTMWQHGATSCTPQAPSANANTNANTNTNADVCRLLDRRQTSVEGARLSEPELPEPLGQLELRDEVLAVRVKVPDRSQRRNPG